MRHPQVAIHGANYPAPQSYQMIAKVIGWAKWITLGTIIFAEKIQLWQMLNMEPPAAYTWTQQNKVSCVIIGV